jgi:hypothetical protein
MRKRLNPLQLITLVLLAIPVHSFACSARAVPIESIAAPLEGKVQQAFACTDAEGSSIYVETRAPTGAGSIKPGTILVSFYKFQQSASGQWLKRWQARDFIAAGKQARISRTVRFIVKDVDSDKIDEAFISYSLPSASASPEDGKLLVYYKDRKFAIRGAVGMGPTDFSTRNLDAGFTTLPASIQNYALGMWDTVAMPRSVSFSPAGTAIRVTQGMEH